MLQGLSKLLSKGPSGACYEIYGGFKGMLTVLTRSTDYPSESYGF